MKNKIKVLLIVGGASKENGISLNSCRSVSDHLPENIEKKILYYNSKLEPFIIDSSFLYCNTPKDFEFKLSSFSNPLSKDELNTFLKSIDFAIPLIHGPFGEDGELQEILESNNVPFLGSSSKSCKEAFDKYEAYQKLDKNNYKVLPHILVNLNEDNENIILEKINSFFKNKFENYIVKPCRGGSSIDVYKVNSIDECLNAINKIKEGNVYKRILIEKFVKGREFTVIILENLNNEAVSLIPSEIIIKKNEESLFDYRKKYLATNETRYIHPPEINNTKLSELRNTSEKIFKLFKLKDYVRIDGWILEDDEIIFTDINCASGMEQNSFFFLQSALLGFSHKSIINYLFCNALKKSKINYELPLDSNENKEEIGVIFGGETAEKNVSIMSGTNVWLKLKKSNRYSPKPYFLDPELNVWEIPYAFALFHTSEEIKEVCENSLQLNNKLKSLRAEILALLNPDSKIELEKNFIAKKYSVTEFLKNQDLLFIALHGDFGEGGELQKLCEKHSVIYTASKPEVLKLCMDKAETGEFIKKLNHPEIATADRLKIEVEKLTFDNEEELLKLWNKLESLRVKSNALIVKPLGDGCSAGIARLETIQDLKTYIEFLKNNIPFIPANDLSAENRQIEMPTNIPKYIIFEEFIETDKIKSENNKPIIEEKSGYIEITVGVRGTLDNLKAMNPSITVTDLHVLTLEEKFQGGTGVNVTPPPKEIVSSEMVEKVKKNISYLANKVKISGIARIDCFLERKTGKLIIIEMNAIPGLSPSTVAYHQAFAEDPPLNPTEFLEEIVDNAKEEIESCVSLCGNPSENLLRN